MLLGAGAAGSLEAKEPSGGRTALLLAAEAGEVECVELLLQAGAQASARSAQGRTARDLLQAAHGGAVARSPAGKRALKALRQAEQGKP